MSKKAVYSNKGLQVYITREDFDKLLNERALDVPLFIGKTQSPGAWIIVKTLIVANTDLRQVRDLEQSAIDQARQSARPKNFRYD